MTQVTKELLEQFGALRDQDRSELMAELACRVDHLVVALDRREPPE